MDALQIKESGTDGLLLAPEEINAIFHYVTDGQPALGFKIRKEGDAYEAAATVHYGKQNVRLNTFRFRKVADAPADPDDSYFGADSQLRFLGSSSKPLHVMCIAVMNSLKN